jgi:nucleotide-binding universal stress UspA family protein
MTLRPIVAAVDGSPESLCAAEWAAGEAQRRRAPLRLVTAPALPPRMHGASPAAPAVAEELRAESVRALDEAVTRVEEVSSGLLIAADLIAGPAALGVTDSGAGALMLVVGARGAGGFAAMLLGSVSRYTAMHAHCPVIVVREETSAVHREVVVGVRDAGDCTAAALGFAFEEAALREAALVVVHSVDQPRDAARRPADFRLFATEAERELAQGLRPWQEKYPGVTVRQDIVPGHCAQVLASYTTRSDLVVVGRHGPAIGGIQHAVLSHARGPVAVVPIRH